MPGITPVNSKESLPKGLQYPLRYVDIGTAFQTFIEHDVFIESLFSRCVYRLAQTKDNLDDEYSLISVRYNPTITWWESGPWDDVEEPVKVSVFVDAIPTLLGRDVIPSRTVLRMLLCDHIPKLLAETIHEKPFYLYLNLRLNPARIQIETQVGETGEAGFHEDNVEILLTELNQTIEAKQCRTQLTNHVRRM